VDCEKFDRVVLDLLYDELDELTRAAARRHMEHCARCGPIANGLRATREVGVVPMVAPPPALELRILEAERRVRARLPLRQRLGRAVSVVAGYAMRPQLGMVALLLLMIGSSLLVLRSHPSERDEARVKESGVPEIEGENSLLGAELSHGQPAPPARRAAALSAQEPHKTATALEPVSPSMAPGRGARTERPKGRSHAVDDSPREYDKAMAAYQSGDYAEAERRFSTLARAGGSRAPEAALRAAQATREGWGCAAAAPKLADIAARYPDSTVGYDATWQAAICYRDLGQRDRAEHAFRALLHAPSYEQRAADALAALTEQPVAVAKQASAASREQASAATPVAPAAQSPRLETPPTTAEQAASEE
jgi:TolA-binding protein